MWEIFFLIRRFIYQSESIIGEERSINLIDGMQLTIMEENLEGVGFDLITSSNVAFSIIGDNNDPSEQRKTVLITYESFF